MASIRNIEVCNTIIPMRTLSCQCEGTTFHVDIVLNNGQHPAYEAWLYHDNSGLKEMMFGSAVYQEYRNEVTTLDTFIELVIANLESYVLSYIDFYIDN